MLKLPNKRTKSKIVIVFQFFSRIYGRNKKHYKKYLCF